VDLGLMARLSAAMQPEAHLILLGDRHQLASVEPGRVFGDICSTIKGGCVVELERSHRFAPDSGIAMLAEAVRSSDWARVGIMLKEGKHPDVSWAPLPTPAGMVNSLEGLVLGRFADCLEGDDPLRALESFNRFRVLCALRQGPYGVNNVNAVCEAILRKAGLIHPSRGGLYRGRPVLVTRNDYSIGLFNGDTGVLWPDPSVGGALTACFPCPDGGIRRIAPARLPPHETSWAMTVHKAQGSEFDGVLLVLPDRESPVVTTELLYTAITRARIEMVIMGRALSLYLGGEQEG
ncbi:MAG: ATP-binding domain-containing protein, partial [Deltaproteobacteria bacterium]|nr:ATP-binding domain-containing protein [Deltaproteobacteria bacterium]